MTSCAAAGNRPGCERSRHRAEPPRGGTAYLDTIETPCKRKNRNSPRASTLFPTLASRKNGGVKRHKQGAENHLKRQPNNEKAPTLLAQGQSFGSAVSQNILDSDVHYTAESMSCQHTTDILKWQDSEKELEKKFNPKKRDSLLLADSYERLAREKKAERVRS